MSSKDSGIEWVGKIPKHWRIAPLYSFFYERKHQNRLLREDNLLSLSYGKIVRKNINTSEGLLPSSFNTYNIVEKNDIVIRPTDLQNDKRSLRTGLVTEHGIITSAYITIARKINALINTQYAHYLLHSYDLTKVFYNMGNGVRQGLNFKEFSKLLLLLPPISEQDEIVRYLDVRCSEIDALTADIEKQIKTLEEYKKSVITEAVTKGLDPTVPMKDSGIEWIGKIPEGWHIQRMKYVGMVKNGLTYSPSDIVDEDQGTLVLRSSNVQNGRVVLNDNVYVRCAIPANLMVRDGDILICSRNGSRELIGKNALIPKISATYGAFMMVFRCNVPKFMYYVLNSHIFSYYLGTFFTSTINQLTSNNFSNMKFVLCPSETEVSKVTDYLDAKCAEIDETINLKQQQLETLAEYKKSLIYEYVTGKKEVPV